MDTIESIKTEQLGVSEFTNLGTMVSESLKNSFFIDPNHTNEQQISSGFKYLDKITQGFSKGELIITAIKPTLGKTAFLLTLTNNIAVKKNKGVAILSSVRTPEKLVNRFIETETGMSIESLKAGNFKDSHKARISAIMNNIVKANIYIDDTPRLSIDEIESKVYKLKENHSIDFILIDHLDILSTSEFDADVRSKQLENIVKHLKRIAVESDLPIMLFYEISKFDEYKSNGAGVQINHLPEFISDNADTVFIIHRNDFCSSNVSKPIVAKDFTEIVIAKHQNCNEPVSVALKFIDSIGKFIDFE